MKRFHLLYLVLVFITVFASLALPAATFAQAPAGPNTYTVMVGAENVKWGIDLETYFPQILRIHPGDKVVFNQNSFEIHTVTFLAPNQSLPDLLVAAPNPPFPPGAMMLNPEAAFPVVPSDDKYDGSYTNSGIMSLDTGQLKDFTLIFPNAGTFQYYCIVHGVAMTGTIQVVSADVRVPSPATVSGQAKRSISLELVKAIPVYFEALRKVPAPVRNPDGTKTYTVLMGYNKGNVDLMDFFPRKLNVRPNDTVLWEMSASNMAPHTVSFLNGADEPELVMEVPNPPGPPFLLINPDLALPHNADQPLTRTGVYSTGIMEPGMPAMGFTIGNISGSISYMCELHDASGMVATLNVVPRKDH